MHQVLSSIGASAERTEAIGLIHPLPADPISGQSQAWPFTEGHRVQNLQGEIHFKRKSYLLKANSFTKSYSPEKDNALQVLPMVILNLTSNDKQQENSTGWRQ